ncbi:MAG: glycosyl hydrolase, partial [Eubacteriales bacterium]
NDETRMCNPLPWSQDFADEFLKRKGYSIYPVLIHLILSGEEAGRTKCDYYDVLASLYQENYFHTLQTWCENHGISFCAHLLGEETLHGHTRFSGDYLRQNRYLDIPGADHLGKGIGSLNLKFTSTGAHSYGKDMTAVEMFAGAGLDLTYDEYIRMVTWAFQCGMKCIVNHGFSYSLRGDRINDWPPSQFFQWVGWEHMKEGNEMIRRLHYALTGGKSEEQILVYHPLESFWLHYEPDLNYTYAYHKGPITKSEKAADIDQGMQVLLNRLLEENKGFEMIHKDALDNFVVKGKQIENVVMNQQFDVLILPYCQVLSIEMLMKCLAFASHGGKIFIFSEIPTYAMKKEDDEKLVALTKQLMEYESVVFLERTEEDALFSEIENSIQPPLKVVEGIGKNKNNRPTYERRLQDPYMHHGEDLSGVMYVHYKKGNLRNTVFMNYDEMETEVIVEVESLSIPELWDTMTGEVKIPEHEKIGEMIYRCKFILPVGYGIILQSHYVK